MFENENLGGATAPPPADAHVYIRTINLDWSVEASRSQLRQETQAILIKVYSNFIFS